MISSLFQCGSKIDTTIVCFQVSQQPAQPAKVVASPVVRTILTPSTQPVIRFIPGPLTPLPMGWVTLTKPTQIEHNASNGS